ncbi:Hypothetical predicted protein [Mytilus galloprovincialis]|uniref:Uncharacterized protein n=1 Tax=Mytilus galloprovincialis TaxID=29158 RepID=A0A8B6G8B9_MYTGA|nr:Hypothetical predicted protein [Mytilus galloprovincialis]
MKDCYVDLSFNPKSTQKDSPKGYSDVVRDLAITFCRVSKSLPIFEKSDGIWKTQPHDWNPDHLYYSPCNTGKRQEKHQDQKLVDNSLVYCERKSISIPAELQLVANAWKLGNSHDICKQYTIWSSMAIIQHSLKYLEIEGLLEKPHVQQSLKQIGVSLHCEKSPNQHNNDSIINTDNESKVSGLPNNSLSANQIGTKSSSPLCSASDSDMVCSQHPYEADAITNSHTTKYVITCQKHDFINQPSTSGCTIYSKTAHCQKRRVDLQSRDVRDLNDSHKSLSEILHQKHDFQLSSFGCSSFTKRAHCLMASDDLPSKDERIQKRKRTISEDRLEKRSRLHLENESQASTSSITRFNGVTTPSSHCDSDILDQDVHSSNTEEEVDQDQSSNRIPVPDNIQDTGSSNTQLSGSGDEIPEHLLQYLNTYISCDDLEENLGEDLEQIDIQLKLWETS